MCRKDGLAVYLEGGEKLSADIVLISAGVRPELTLAKSLGLAIDKGVKVDDSMKTEIQDIYAAGDLIEHQGRFYGIWPASMEQGRIAGANMAGQEMKYLGTVLFNPPYSHPPTQSAQHRAAPGAQAPRR